MFFIHAQKSDQRKSREKTKVSFSYVASVEIPSDEEYKGNKKRFYVN